MKRKLPWRLSAPFQFSSSPLQSPLFASAPLFTLCVRIPLPRAFSDDCHRRAGSWGFGEVPSDHAIATSARRIETPGMKGQATARTATFTSGRDDGGRRLQQYAERARIRIDHARRAHPACKRADLPGE